MKTKILFAALAVAGFTGTASAIIPIGDPIEGDSWSQAFFENPGGTGTAVQEAFDTIVIQMSSTGDYFGKNTPAMWGFSGVLNWHVEYVDDADNQTYLVATGDVVGIGDTLDFTIGFAGEVSDPLQFKYAVFLEGELVEYQEVGWNGSGWYIVPNCDPIDAPILIPLPAPVWLAAAGLGGVFLLRRRKTL